MAMLLPESLSVALAADDQANTEKKKKGKNRKIKSILAWTECFLTYMGVVLAKQPERSQDLLGYANLIVHAARQFEGTQWQVYDTRFRQIAAGKKSVNWSQVNTSIWTMAFAHAQPASHCPLCLGLSKLLQMSPLSRSVSDSTSLVEQHLAAGTDQQSYLSKYI